jgi:hypothetical protein
LNKLGTVHSGKPGEERERVKGRGEGRKCHNMSNKKKFGIG